MAKFSIGPPAGGFPIGSLFLIIVTFASFYAMALAGIFNPFLRNLAFGALGSLFIFALFGKWLQSHGGVGQLAFIGLGLGVIIFADQISSAFNLHLSVVRLSFAQVSFTINGADYTWLLLVLFLAALYLARKDIVSWVRGQF